MRKFFWIFYSCLVLSLGILGKVAYDYTNKVLIEYEASQPERLVEQQIETLLEACQNNTIDELISFPEIIQSEYDKAPVSFEAYKKNLSNAAELTYRVKTGSFDETGQTFQILADGTPIALVTLTSVSEKQQLGILKTMDWQVKEITPITTLTNYEYTVNVPEGFLVTINNKEAFKVQTEAGIDSYHFKDLFFEPEFHLYDTYGYEADYNMVENVITPVVHTYSLQLPNSYTVFVGDKELPRTGEENTSNYIVTTAKESLTLVDAYGHQLNYTGTEDIYAYDYEITLPDNFTITWDNRDLSKYLISQEDIEKYQYCEEYTKMPKLNTFCFPDSLEEVSLTVTDNLGKEAPVFFENGVALLTEQAILEKIPEELEKEVDVMKIAKTWSDFMTKDLSGSQNGFGTIKKYLIKDSYMYSVSYKWATGIDISFTSAHRTSENYYTDEKVTNFIQYNDNLFSCDISFVKHMYLHKKNQHVEDEMNSTFYFLRHGEGSDARWVILDIQEILQ